MAHTLDELQKLSRLELRNVAKECGLSLKASTDMASPDIREYVIKHGGSNGTKPVAAAQAPVAVVVQTPPTALAVANPDNLFIAEQFETERNYLRVIDRKLNIILGALGAMAKQVVHEDFDIDDAEITHTDDPKSEDKNNIDLSLIERTAPEDVVEGH